VSGPRTDLGPEGPPLGATHVPEVPLASRKQASVGGPIFADDRRSGTRKHLVTCEPGKHMCPSFDTARTLLSLHLLQRCLGSDAHSAIQLGTYSMLIAEQNVATRVPDPREETYRKLTKRMKVCLMGPTGGGR
jgi:hypothetical protein